MYRLVERRGFAIAFSAIQQQGGAPQRIVGECVVRQGGCEFLVGGHRIVNLAKACLRRGFAQVGVSTRLSLGSD